VCTARVPAARAPEDGSLKKLLLITPVVVAAFLVHRAFDPSVVVIRIEYLAMMGLAVAGPVLAMLCFDRGDHLRRAWLGFAVSYVGLFESSFFRIVLVEHTRWVRYAGYIVSNVAAPIGAFLFATAASVAGLELPGSKLTRRASYFASFGVAVAMAGPSFYQGIKHWDFPDGLIPVISAAGDLITFAMLVPILMTALALRGGLVAWVWIFLTAAELSWLLYDLLVAVIQTDARWTDFVDGGFRSAALVLTFTAGLAQYRISRARLSPERGT
jgi:hypothetical protein